MKCVILAGGSSDRLWPLSRKTLPKQFMHVRKNRSLFQEIIARNIPFCDEFLVVTNASYEHTVKAQLKEFQGIRCRCLLEQEGKGTAPAIALAAMSFAADELIYVVPADHIISSGDYRSAVLEAKTLAEQGFLAAVGVTPESPHQGYGYLRRTDAKESDLPAFKEKPDLSTATAMVDSGDYLWNCGLYIFRSEIFLNELKRHTPEVYQACLDCFLPSFQDKKSKPGLIPQKPLDALAPIGIERALFERTDLLRSVQAHMSWKDIAELEALADYAYEEDSSQVIKNNCENTTIINRCDDQLVVANRMDDALIINTPDGLFITKKGYGYEMKQILRDHHDEYADFFDHDRVLWRSWGYYEILREEPAFRIKRVTLYPGRSMRLHRHAHRSEHWTIVSGHARIIIDGKSHEYTNGDTVSVTPGTYHRLSNIGEENLLIIETSMGKILQEEDTLSQTSELPYEIIKLAPFIKDALWGGTNLYTDFGKGTPGSIVAETWELSAHPFGTSTVISGPCCGLIFNEYLERLGADGLGWKSQAFQDFPILVKYIDADSCLSIQVHPGDDYAMAIENEYGKNEMWHILGCREGAFIYYGFNRDVTREEVAERILNGTIEEVLNAVPVHPGDTYFIEAGTVHAIGAGITVCEIQQSSNSTYRLYDFQRRDKDGNLRELHLDRALDVMNLKRSTIPETREAISPSGIAPGTAIVQQLGSCKYFESSLYVINGETTISMSDASFMTFTVLEGHGRILYGDRTIDFKKGDSLFAPAAQIKLQIEGTCRLIATHI
ncbi:MAG: cupin domain-containing protein [Lachnospiraceae bacterium]|nr:cupin domain-containing protein [Lachnospiraceae bacterium]